jgi:IS30 family transposase
MQSNYTQNNTQNNTKNNTKNNTPNYLRLTHQDRVRIEYYLVSNLKPNQIAIKLNCHRSTVVREINRNLNFLGHYTADYANKKTKSRVRKRRLGKLKILTTPPLKQFVEDKLKLAWSPFQIASILKIEFKGIKSMQISHEAIYQYIYVLPRGELKKTLINGLRQNRKYRRSPRIQKQDEEKRGKIKDMLSIHERPLEVQHRIIPGHWESDLIIGKYKQSAVATLVERVTRYTLIVPLPSGKDALSVRVALQGAVKTIPEHLRRTLTHDQGKEMSQHKQFTIDTNMTVYFADPSSPWQRGTNENTNGLIRQFFPKGTDFRIVSEQEIQRVQDLLNGRPRQVLDFKTPNEVYSKYVALGC